MPKFTNDLVLRDSGDGKTFYIDQQFDYLINHAEYVRVKKDFRTDLASIPRLAQLIVPKISKANQAAVVHDYLYHHRHIWSTVDSFDHYTEKVKHISRSQADKIFLQAMKYAGVRYTRRQAIYLAVRAGGWIRWNQCRNC